MANEVEVWGYCDANCKHRVLTLDQTVALIQEMAANGFQVPEGFIPKTAVNEIVEQNKGKSLKLFVGTQAEYDAWNGDKENTHPIISDDPTIKNILDKLGTTTNIINKMIDGNVGVGRLNSTPVTFTTDEKGQFIWDEYLTMNTMYAVFSQKITYLGMVVVNEFGSVSETPILSEGDAMIESIYLDASGRGYFRTMRRNPSNLFDKIVTPHANHEITFVPICSLN